MMTMTKCKLHLLLLLCGLFCFASCDKESIEELEVLAELTELRIETEACFNPHCMTLILGQLDKDNLFSEVDEYKHQIDWYKNGELFRSATNRLDCTGSGKYEVRVLFREVNVTRKLKYTLNLNATH